MKRLVSIVCLLAAAGAPCSAQQASSLGAQRQSAFALEREGQTVRAEAIWKAILSKNPQDAEAYAHLGLLEAHQEHYKEAIAFYRKGLRLDPNMPNLALNLGLSLFKVGDLRGAIEVFEPLMKNVTVSSPDAVRLATLLGLSHYGLGEYANAVPYLKQVTDGDPKDLSMRMMLAQSCLWSKQYQCVLDTYRQILDLNPNSAEADVLAGEAYDELHDDGSALSQLQAAVQADPRLPNVHFEYGYLLWRALKYTEAQAQFEAELASNPGNALALAYLGDTKYKLNQPSLALPYLQKAVQLQPSIAIAHLDLGAVYQGQGKNQDALVELQAAEKLDPTDTTAHWQLAQLYKSMGRVAEAKAEFTKTQTIRDAADRSLRVQMHQAGPNSSTQSAAPASK